MHMLEGGIKKGKSGTLKPREIIEFEHGWMLRSVLGIYFDSSIPTRLCSF